ncbi:HD domain-containing protein [Herbiconiux liukaitaii]|uniref:HD domain-containing protein n=1 Tax=Herbiconiux liukaitaii TaxID=3342799 RepID=UPI0035B88B95
MSTPFDRAVAVAREHHGGQTDKIGRPYIEHPLAVAALLSDEDDRIVAVLHDILEDTDCPPDLLAELFGEEVLDDVLALTHLPEESRVDYLHRILARGGRAVRVKKADIRHNTDPARLDLLDDPTRRRLLQKYRESAALLGTSLEAIHGPEVIHG